MTWLQLQAPDPDRPGRRHRRGPSAGRAVAPPATGARIPRISRPGHLVAGLPA
ncbi:hypothetical protein G5V59_12985 [Nocardioides sp. W3-2-3]|uniref:hypothetical protein n=1 Tax=Nocardioides convexus TaxID=2712224 RepID=UPI0024184C56|nr:hypothetical protein [Nocardioides convexus]NHA00629.1 hypothetical protein [Nocardioides convexus]